MRTECFLRGITLHLHVRSNLSWWHAHELLSRLAAQSGGERRHSQGHRLKPLLGKSGPSGRPTAKRRLSPGFDSQLCVVTCSHLPGKRAPHLLSSNSPPAIQNVRTRLTTISSTDFDARRASMNPISRTGGTKLQSHVPCSVRSALYRLGHSPAGGPCHSRAQR